ncbi:uncharacterized protein LOC116589863 [Mustela erminea]|uniref:uncharacterized protein LOC116589863 n=1 Tax=Mustela erminea TaxID=36723 RepID=UPI001386DB9C|nr:uncharacterized protein LOC116589863 [Mustela erminea]
MGAPCASGQVCPSWGAQYSCPASFRGRRFWYRGHRGPLARAAPSEPACGSPLRLTPELPRAGPPRLPLLPLRLRGRQPPLSPRCLDARPRTGPDGSLSSLFLPHPSTVTSQPLTALLRTQVRATVVKAPAGLWTGAGRVCVRLPGRTSAAEAHTPIRPPPGLLQRNRVRASLRAGAPHAVSSPLPPWAPPDSAPQERHGEATAAFRMVLCAVCCVCRRAEKISLKRKQGPVKKARFGQPGCCWGTAPRGASLDTGLFPTFRGWCVSPSYTLFCFDQALADGPGTREGVGPQGPGLASASWKGQEPWAPPVGPDTGDLGTPGPYRQGIRQDPEDALPCASASAPWGPLTVRIGQRDGWAAPGTPSEPLSAARGGGMALPPACLPRGHFHF